MVLPNEVYGVVTKRAYISENKKRPSVYGCKLEDLMGPVGFEPTTTSVLRTVGGTSPGWHPTKLDDGPATDIIKLISRIHKHFILTEKKRSF